MIVFIASAGNLFDTSDTDMLTTTFALAAERLKEQEGLEVTEENPYNQNDKRWDAVCKHYLWGVNETHDKVRSHTLDIFSTKPPQGPNCWMGDFEPVLNAYPVMYRAKFSIMATPEEIAEKKQKWAAGVEKIPELMHYELYIQI